MIILHKTIIGLILSSLVFIFPSATITPIINIASSVNAGRYIALPESMAWQCADTVKNRHNKRIKQAAQLNVDPIIKQQVIDFEQVDYERDLKLSCGIADLSELPDRNMLMEIKP